MFHSEHGQDKWLAEHIWPHKTGGVFAEIGALDGLMHSNTLYFERERGWTGICVEANPATYDALQANRDGPACKAINCAVWKRDGFISFTTMTGGLFGWSGITEAIEPQHWDRIEKNIPDDSRHTVEVPAMSLENVFKMTGLCEIDYVSLDIEGAEYDVLTHFPFGKFDVDVWDIEDNFDNHPIGDIMHSAGYRQIATLGVNRIYRRKDKC